VLREVLRYMYYKPLVAKIEALLGVSAADVRNNAVCDK